jgi:hypothetical protein
MYLNINYIYHGLKCIEYFNIIIKLYKVFNHIFMFVFDINNIVFDNISSFYHFYIKDFTFPMFFNINLNLF